ncbi:MAG: Gfo/Idh/MocA family protein [Halobacteriales archaeon]
MTYSAGIIGTGGVAGMGFIGVDESFNDREQVRSTHAGGYDATDDVELIAACDTDEEQLATFGDLWEVPPENMYDDHRDMLESENLDALSICTPTFLHRQHTLDALHVSNPPEVIWCEKPIASSVSAGREMVRQCRDAGVELVISYPRRFDPDYHLLRDKLLQEGVLGDVKSINLQFKRELLRNGAHMIDAVTYLLDDEVSELTGFLTGTEELTDSIVDSSDIDDSGGGALLTMRDGTFVTVDCTVSRDVWSGYLRLLGTGGTLIIDQGDDEWRYWSDDGTDHRRTDLWDGYAAGPTPDLDASFTNAAAHVVDLLDGVATNRSSGTDAIHVMEVLVGIFVSSYTGSHLSLPMERPLEDVSIRSW